MQAYVAVGWKADEKSKRVIPFGIYCGPDGVAAEKAVQEQRVKGGLLGVTIQIVYRSARPMAVTVTEPAGKSHRELVADGERKAAEVRKAAEAEDAKRIAETHPKGEVAAPVVEEPLASDHTKRRKLELEAAKAAAAAERDRLAAKAQSEKTRQEAEKAAAKALAESQKQAQAAKPADPAPEAEQTSHGDRLVAKTANQ